MRRVSDERGAVAVIVALLMVALIGMAALVVDAGALYQERRELQNGADAAALAIAEDCAREPADCTLALTSAKAGDYANANADDGEGDAVVDTTDFDPTGRVTVRTSTRQDGGTIVPYVFASVFGVLDSEGDYDGKTVHAAATAEWGNPSSLASIPLTVSSCEFNAATNDGTLFDSPPYDAAGEQTLIFHDGNGATECAAQAGHDTDGDGSLPGGFGWLVEDGACQVVTTTIDDHDWVTQADGNDPECDAAELAGLVGTVVPVPVFDDVCRHTDAGCPTFNNRDKYRIARYAAFYLTGYDLGGPSYERYDPEHRSSPPDCGTASQDDQCVTGFFTTAVISGGSTGGASGGVITINLVPTD